MADLRYDPITSVWVAIASNRRARPMEFFPLEEVRQQLICPFCSGNENETPRSIATYLADRSRLPSGDVSDHWVVRVVPNKYPSLNEQQSMAANGGPFQSTHRDGIQEIVIPSPRHVNSLSELTELETEMTWLACRDRLAELEARPDVHHLMLFMNCGLAAGATLGHIHLQIMASPIVSQSLQQRVDLNHQHRQQHGQTLLDSVLEWEQQQATRIVEASEDWVVVCPYASRFAFQTWVVPRRNNGRFAEQSESQLQQLGRHLTEQVRRLEAILDKPAYNVLLHQSPCHGEGETTPWYIELFPRLTRLAGYELGTEIWVNPVSPEAAARRLRSISDS